MQAFSECTDPPHLTCHLTEASDPHGQVPKTKQRLRCGTNVASCLPLLEPPFPSPAQPVSFATLQSARSCDDAFLKQKMFFLLRGTQRGIDMCPSASARGTGYVILDNMVSVLPWASTAMQRAVLAFFVSLLFSECSGHRHVVVFSLHRTCFRRSCLSHQTRRPRVNTSHPVFCDVVGLTESGVFLFECNSRLKWRGLRSVPRQIF